MFTLFIQVIGMLMGLAMIFFGSISFWSVSAIIFSFPLSYGKEAKFLQSRAVDAGTRQEIVFLRAALLVYLVVSLGGFTILGIIIKAWL